MNLFHRIFLYTSFAGLLLSGQAFAQSARPSAHDAAQDSGPQAAITYSGPTKVMATPGVPPAAPHYPDSALIAWLSGSWSGEGAFANGSPIKARLSVRPALDNAWLVLEHQDLPPHRYASSSFWGSDVQTGQALSYVFDNFHGHRLFTGSGWHQDSIVWQCQNERFIYRRLNDRQLKMTYEASKDGISWHLGDYLVFTKIDG